MSADYYFNEVRVPAVTGELLSIQINHRFGRCVSKQFNAQGNGFHSKTVRAEPDIVKGHSDKKKDSCKNGKSWYAEGRI